MKNHLRILFSAIFFLSITTLAIAQPKLPAPSPGAEAMQTVGLTDVKVVYSSPAVKGRTVWGGLEKYGKVWRAGANSPTKISFSNDVTINGKSIKKGDYVLMLDLKDANNWEWILATKGSAFGFKEADVVVRTKATVTKGLRNKERLAYYISADTDEKGTVNLRWEKIEASFSFKGDVKGPLMASVKKFAGQASWFNLGNTGYQVVLNSDKEKELKLAKGMIDASVAMGGENMINTWWKAALMAKMGKKKDAYKLGKKVKELYAKEKRAGWKNFYKNTIEADLEKGMKTWK
jgi:hypothetical protein